MCIRNSSFSEWHLKKTETFFSLGNFCYDMCDRFITARSFNKFVKRLKLMHL